MFSPVFVNEHSIEFPLNREFSFDFQIGRAVRVHIGFRLRPVEGNWGFRLRVDAIQGKDFNPDFNMVYRAIEQQPKVKTMRRKRAA